MEAGHHEQWRLRTFGQAVERRSRCYCACVYFSMENCPRKILNAAFTFQADCQHYVYVVVWWKEKNKKAPSTKLINISQRLLCTN